MTTQLKTRQRLLVLLRERGAMSRAELARELGLSNSTVSTAVADLVAAGMVIEALDAGRVYRDRLLGAGVGLPGPIHRAPGTPAPSMIPPGWAGVHVAEELGARLRIPISVDNEANLEAPAELTWGAGDPAIARVLARAGEVAGTAMAGVCNVLNPRRVVVGGAHAVSSPATCQIISSVSERDFPPL